MQSNENYVNTRKSKRESFQTLILMIFAYILVPQTPPKSGWHSTCFRHFRQDTSKMSPRCPQAVPRSLQDTSKRPLRPPKTPPRRLWTAQRCLQAASSCSETPQECYKIEGFEKSVNFYFFSFDVSSFFMFSGFPWRGKGQAPLSKQFIC